MRKIKVGIIQQANTADLRTNLMNLAKSIEACAAHGAQLVVLQELHNSLYFCQTENTQLFDLAETIPGPSTGFYSELAAANAVSTDSRRIPQEALFLPLAGERFDGHDFIGKALENGAAAVMSHRECEEYPVPALYVDSCKKYGY